MRRRNRGSRRIKTVNMNEMLHIILSLQLMFGSRRAMGGLLIVLLVCGVGYLAYGALVNPVRDLEKADRMWDNDQQAEAIREYKALLRKRDPIEPQYALLPAEDRPRLFRRVITHEARYASRAEARDWISMAYQEGINFERADFERQEVYDLWVEVTTGLRESGGRKRDLAKEVTRQNENSKTDDGDVTDQLNRANLLWEDDRQVEARLEYRRLLREESDRLSRADRRKLYRRLISYETRYGNRVEAKEWIEKAKNDGHTYTEQDLPSSVYNLWIEVTKEKDRDGKLIDRLDEILDPKKDK